MSVNSPAGQLNGANAGLTMDLRSLERLKATSGQSPKGAIRETAKQLESLFMQELMKSMRATTMNTGMMDNQATEMGTSMLDTQFAGQMTGRPGGLSDLIARQLERQMGIKPEDGSAAGQLNGQARGRDKLGHDSVAAAPAEAAGAAGAPAAGNPRLSASEQFIRKHQAAAQAAEAATGMASSHILGQAALESGWGKREIRMKDGTPSHNLFGIKATPGWTGKVAEVTTTEYIGGVARKVTAKFRAYDSYADAFKDHARLLSQSPRYSQTVAQADTASGFAKGLQKAGYATDPAYADKLTKVINTALRVQRSMA
ncbi:MAG: flagellar assembly peptidoglycan hydrolase FlgJ [Proteobacteria bacterium]|uniref:flagellar assembly peptidoglycan hydrolase FlgJ n=1 Tax=Aquabacterium sp. TaxID=1872578 RepID=UPI0035C71E69|nr:flagellar assembly peptidoglycan hydrolase FlgJ [Pseudomonadota bacterium]